MPSAVLLLNCPFTQLNTPYPATAYLKGFLNLKAISNFQVDLGLEVVLRIFRKTELQHIFELAEPQSHCFAENEKRIFSLRDQYINTIEPCIKFLQGKDPTLAYLIAGEQYLPQASRFEQLTDLEWAFGSMGIQDKAKHLATLYLEDLSDFIKNCIDPNFGFSRYAEKIARSANSYDSIYEALQSPLSYTEKIMLGLMEEHIGHTKPSLVAISIPFPGNLLSSLRCGQFIKQKYPEIKIALGGGFCNTELRDLKDSRIFECCDFISLDDGEICLEQIYKYCIQEIEATQLKRTFVNQNNTLHYYNNQECNDYKQHENGTPDYTDLRLDQYISVIEVLNPMHSLWSDGRWNKLTMAHGCYWGKCTFCDISLDYIKNYEPQSAGLICDKIETLIAQTGNTGFHFVDEAAPPALMKALALEILKRKLVISWWTNIRFEISFTRDLCLLFKASGCIGVSGGLEVASNRLLELINKGITVEQVAIVNKNFCDAGIMVHAYLMYGFPTQTAQETIDSLEMVRQMFLHGVLQSAYWHQFTMTAHSPVGLNPEQFKVKKATSQAITFANNDIEHIDPTGTEHELFTYGLKKSLFNYMHGIGLNEPLKKWFDPNDFPFALPNTSIAKDYIFNVLKKQSDTVYKENTRFVFTGKILSHKIEQVNKKGRAFESFQIEIASKKQNFKIALDRDQGQFLHHLLQKLETDASGISFAMIKEMYAQEALEDFELFWYNKPMNQSYKWGLWGV